MWTAEGEPVGRTVIALNFAPNGSTSPQGVLDSDEGLLSLGRAVMSEASRFGPFSKVGSSMGASVHIRVWPSGRPSDFLPSPLEEIYRWGTRFSLSRKTPWFPAIAYVLCAPPAGQFVRDTRRLCAGLLGSPLSAVAARDNASGTVDGVAAPARATPSDHGRGVSWTLRRPNTAPDLQAPEEPQPPPAALFERPCWLAGLGSREVNPNSPDEESLAAHIRPVDVNVSADGPVEWPGTGLSEGGHLAWLAGLTETYDRGVCGKEPPEDPTTDAELVLAVLVVLPELVDLTVLLISTRDRSRRDLSVLLLVFLSGLFSLGGATALAVREAAGARWRASGVRIRLDTDPVGRGGRVVGQRALRTELLVLAACTGYRPTTAWGLLAGLSVTYVTASVAVAAPVWSAAQTATCAQWKQWRRFE